MSSVVAYLTLIAGAFILFAPGLILAFRLRLRGILAWSVAPAISLMMAGGLAVVFSLLGIPFNLLSFVLAVAVIAGIVELFARAFNLPEIGRWAPGRKKWWLFGALILLATIIPVFPLLFFYGLDQPIQHMDPAFHMNAVYLVEQTEAASSFHDLTRMWGLNTTPTTIPAGWHAFVSLFATKQTIIQATNAMFLLNSTVWALGVATLTLVAFPGRDWAPFIALTVSTLVVEYPTYMHSAYPVLPNATTLAILPGLLAWAYATVFRRFRQGHWDRERKAVVGSVLAVIVVVLGAMLTHPVIALNMFVLMFLPLVFGWFNKLRHLVQNKQWKYFWLQIAIAVSIVLIPAITLLNDYVREKVIQMATFYNTFPNPSLGAVLKTYALWPMYYAGDAHWFLLRIQSTIQYIIVFLTTVGIIAILRYSKKQRVLIWSLLGIAMITLTTMIRTGPLAIFAGFWYMSPHRAMSAQAAPQIVIMSFGVEATVLFLFNLRKRAKRVRQDTRASIDGAQLGNSKVFLSVLGLLVLIGGVLTQPVRYSYIQRVYDPESNYVTHVASAEELSMMKKLYGEIEDGDLVIGDPFNGSTLLQSYGSAEVLVPQPYYRPENEAENFLKEHFDKIHVNRNVCRLLDDMNVKYFYYDSDGWNYLTNSRIAAPGFYYVDTSVGFTKIAEGGSAKLFRIDVCDKWE